MGHVHYVRSGNKLTPSSISDVMMLDIAQGPVMLSGNLLRLFKHASIPQRIMQEWGGKLVALLLFTTLHA